MLTHSKRTGLKERCTLSGSALHVSCRRLHQLTVRGVYVNVSSCVSVCNVYSNTCHTLRERGNGYTIYTLYYVSPIVILGLFYS